MSARWSSHAAPAETSVQSVDAALDEISAAYNWIEAITPLNAEAIWRDVRRRSAQEPVLSYAPLAVDPDRLRRRLFAIPVAHIGNPVFEELLREKQLEIERQLSLMELRGTRAFIQASLDLFGAPDAQLIEQARAIVAANTAPAERLSTQSCIGAEELAVRAQRELAIYRRLRPDFPVSVRIRDEVTAGVMVCGPEVWIASRVRVPERRVQALLHHEIGTHVLTYYNGLQQPIRQFSSGLAHYDTLQEGLGVFAELASGGPCAVRLRVLAARTLAVKRVIDGASFLETYGAMRRDCGLGKRSAFLTTLRVYRGGGLTKDALYLRGLRDLLAYLAEGGALEPLYLGKIALAHTRLIRELLQARLLEPPALLPRWLAEEQGRQRVEQLRNCALDTLPRGISP